MKSSRVSRIVIVDGAGPEGMNPISSDHRFRNVHSESLTDFQTHALVLQSQILLVALKVLRVPLLSQGNTFWRGFFALVSLPPAFPSALFSSGLRRKKSLPPAGVGVGAQICRYFCLSEQLSVTQDFLFTFGGAPCRGPLYDWPILRHAPWHRSPFLLS